MTGSPRTPPILILIGSALLAGCDSRPGPESDAPPATAFVGATIIDGTGTPPIPNGTLVVEGGRVAAVGPADAVDLPEGATVIDVSGKFLVPGLINTHGHVGGTLGLEGGHYTRQNLLRQLGLYARYGVTTVVSLGGDEAEGVELRNDQDSHALDRGRLFVAGAVVSGETPEEAREMVDGNAALGVDFIKIRVDDNLGTTSKMTPDVYRAVIERAHDLRLPVAAHLFYLEDARGLLDAGVDFVVHSIRDRAVDDDLTRRFVEADVCYTPTLAREFVMFAYEEVPYFFQDPFFLGEADPAVLEILQEPDAMQAVRESESAQRYKQALAQALENLHTLSEAGVTIALGTDTGPPGRFQGYFEHLELGFMAEAGMSPMEILVAATGDAAECIGRDDIGTLATGRWADMIVLGQDPLESVEGFRSIESVWIAGNRVPGSGSAP